MDSPIAISIINKWVNWIIGEGLKLKSNPSRIVLESEGIEMNKKQREAFNDLVEARFHVWANSKKSSFSENDNFYEVSRNIYLNSKINGDCLVILRYVDGMVKVQMIDGSAIMSPSTLPSMDADTYISNGIEVYKKNKKEKGYWINKGGFNYDFVPAYSKTGLRTAFIVRGSKWRSDYHRGLPTIGSMLESIKKIDKYQDATLSSAEEIAKIAYQVVHQAYSSGENPDAQNMLRAIQIANGQDGNQLPTDDLGNQLVSRIAATMQKTAFNNPVGAEIKTLNKGQAVTGFEEFYKTNSHIICAAIGIPPNVAMSIYNDSFSASRAATKDWDHSMDVERALTDFQFLGYVYQFWLFTEISSGKVNAQGYIEAVLNKNEMVKEAYNLARFTGPHFPHIDPDKEVKAIRRMLGPNADHLPLTTIEGASEELGTGDSDSIMEQFADEIKMGDDLGIEKTEKQSVKKSSGIEN
jgi:capsid protein